MENKLKLSENIGKGLDLEHYKKVKAARVRDKRITFMLTGLQLEQLTADALRNGYVNKSDYIRLKLGL